MRETATVSVFAERLSTVIEARLQGDKSGARDMLQSICEVGTVRPSARISARREAAVLARDRYTCRYCGYRLLSIPVLRVVHELFPDVFLWHPNWKASVSDIAWWRDTTSVDHVRPATRGGTNDAENLVASCWPCNSSKGNLTLDELGLTLRPIPDFAWDGLSSRLSDLVRLLPEGNAVQSYFRSWEAAIRNPEVIFSAAHEARRDPPFRDTGTDAATRGARV